MDEIDKVKEDNIDDELIFSLKPIKNKQSKIHLGSELSNVSFGGGACCKFPESIDMVSSFMRLDIT